MKTISFRSSLRTQKIALAVLIGVSIFHGRAQNQTSPPPPVAQQVGAAATEVTQTTLNNAELIWKRIDEKRIKNRTPDEIVAWALMGLLVGGLLSRFTKLSSGATVVVGLVGAFLGGIVSNVLQLDWGLGPVLIRYEELLCSVIGGLVLCFAWRWYRTKAAPKAPAK
jgi:uncharacterized membrane protein YeaQ/YmgE (transglycosylase-associated protein family)